MAANLSTFICCVLLLGYSEAGGFRQMCGGATKYRLTEKLRNLQATLENQNNLILALQAKLDDQEKTQAVLESQMKDLLAGTTIMDEMDGNKTDTPSTESQNELVAAMQTALTELESRVTELKTDFDHHDTRQTNLMFGLFEKSAVYKDRYYLLSKQSTTIMNVSDAMCAYFGGYMIEIDDEAEYNFIKTFLGNYTFCSGVVVGATNKGHPETWLYRHSQRPLGFTNWYPGRPDNSDLKRQCMSLGDDFWMFAARCDNIGGQGNQCYLCEVPLQ